MKQATFFICAFLVLFQVYSGAYAADSALSASASAENISTKTGTDSTSTGSDESTSVSVADSDESSATASIETTTTETETDSTSTGSTDTTTGSLAEYISELVQIWAEIQKLIQENNQSAINEFVTEKIEFFEKVASENEGTLVGTWASNVATQLTEGLASWNAAVDEQTSDGYNFLQNVASAFANLGK